MSEQPPEVPAEPAAEPATSPPVASEPVQSVPPNPFTPVVRVPWVNPARRRHVAGAGLVLALACLGAGIGIGFAADGSGTSTPGQLRIHRGPMPGDGMPGYGMPGRGMPGRGFGPDRDGPGSGGNVRPQPPAGTPTTVPSASPTA